jgi:hypothetical protein
MPCKPFANFILLTLKVDGVLLIKDHVWSGK